MAGKAFVGVSGWTYPHWRKAFYPKGVTRKQELRFVSERTTSLEINGSFYSLQKAASYRRWRNETPDDFIFAVKGGRFITHMKKLKDVEQPLANFFASGLLALGPKLGPILWQLPPNLGFDADRLEAFLKLLPPDTRSAAQLARKHDPRVEDPCIEAEVNIPLRYAFEIRHESYLSIEFVEVMRRHQAAIVFSDAAGEWPTMDDVTADFIYVRLHGAHELYKSGYDEESLAAWAGKIKRWLKGAKGRKAIPARDVYVYFDNDAHVHAPFDAVNLLKLLAAGN